jgi:hypothetical protein
MYGDESVGYYSGRQNVKDQTLSYMENGGFIHCATKLLKTEAVLKKQKPQTGIVE